MGARRCVIAAILTVALAGPVVELFDDWDPTLEQGGGDTESSLVAVALCFGAAFLIDDLLVRQLSPANASSSIRSNNPTTVITQPYHAFVFSVSSSRAPTPLRI